MENVLQKAIEEAQAYPSCCKFISANDCGKTGGHQSGYYIPKSYLPIVFNDSIQKHNDLQLWVTIKWQSSFESNSRFKYYGSKNECHLTNFGKNFPFLTPDNVGDLLILCKISDIYYNAFVLSSDDDIENFFAALNIPLGNPNGLIQKQFEQDAETNLLNCFSQYIKTVTKEFPTTFELASQARRCYNLSNKITKRIVHNNPDLQLLKWLAAEYELFKAFENSRYSKQIEEKFKSIDQLIEIANTILNRRKSRAGKSLEHHLTELFKTFDLLFDSQEITEDNKKPDFIFPGIEYYNSTSFDEKKAIVLACKTTCKDRWRQILNEADKIKTKHLFTLQRGISKNQLEEMSKYHVKLVVPKEHIKSFPKEFHESLYSLTSFIQFVQVTQA